MSNLSNAVAGECNGRLIVMHKSWDAMSCQWVYTDVDVPDSPSGQDMVEAAVKPILESVSLACFLIGVVAIGLAFSV